MGIKLEIILVMSIILTIIMTTTVKLTNNVDNNITMHKELEFIDTTFIEVDQENMKANLFATYGVRDSGVLKLKNLKYHSDSIHKLTSDNGKYHNNILYLDGNVTLREKVGYVYTTHHANYQQKKEILTITSPFVAHMAKNVIYGDTLKYFVGQKVLSATAIDATVYTVEK